MTSDTQNVTLKPESKVNSYQSAQRWEAAKDSVLKSSVNQRLAASNAHKAQQTPVAKENKFNHLSDKFSAFTSAAGVKPEKVAEVFSKEEINFDVKTIEEGNKIMEGFMDRSVKYTPTAILASIKEFYGHMKNNT